MKSQEVRLFDVFALGPFMVVAAMRGQLGILGRLFLLAAGLLTIAYNWDNYRQRAQGLGRPGRWEA